MFIYLFGVFFFSFLLSLGLPRFITQPESASVHRGNPIVLNCEVNADLAPFVRWELDHQPLFLDDRVLKLPSGTLIVSNATDEDAGTYCCVIEIGGSPKYSDEAEIKVLPGTGTCAEGFPLLVLSCAS